MKKQLFILFLIADVLLFLGLVGGVLFAIFGLEDIRTQLTYMQDTISIIQSDVGNLQSNIKTTLEEESSLIESYEVDIVGMNLEAGTYDVAVSVIPKEYTDATQTSIYFGSKEYLLTLNGYAYQGNMTLPLSESYDGNITFLFVNGDKKTTEVLRDYVGITTGLKNVVIATMQEQPEYRNEKISLDTDIDVKIQGNDEYVFEQLHLLATINGEEVYTLDLFEGQMGAIDEFEIATSVEFDQEMVLDDTVRVFIQGVTQQGYTFEYELYKATVSLSEEEKEILIAENVSYIIIDDNNERLELE